MHQEIKRIIKILFPGLVKKISDSYHYNSFKGEFRTFKEVSNLTKSYDSKKIGRKIEKIYKKSRSNINIFDRDGQIVLKKNINFRLLNHINKLTLSNNESYIIDFGGSLCNFYRTNKNYLNSNVSWIVLDKKVTIDIANKYLRSKKIIFFHSIKSLQRFIKIKNMKVDLFLFGSVLQYVDEIEKVLRLVNDLNCKNIIIDRQPMLNKGKTTYSIQKVPFWFGGNSFAVKLYNYRNFINIFNKFNFFLVDSFNGFGNDFKNGKYICQIYRKH